MQEALILITEEVEISGGTAVIAILLEAKEGAVEGDRHLLGETGEAAFVGVEDEYEINLESA